MSQETSVVPRADTNWADSLPTWLQDNLLPEWRDVGGGTTTDDEVAIRRRWGRLLHQGGWGCPLWPREFGGMGLALDEYVRYETIMAEAGAPNPMNSNAIGIVGPTLIRFGTPEQQQRYLPPILEHTEIWCQGFSEPGAGSDLASIRTSARLDGDSYVVNGQKIWTSNSTHADWGYFLVRTAQGETRHDGITWLLIRMDDPGITIRPIRNIAGEENFAEVFLDDVRVPVSQRVGQEGQGWKITKYALDNERVLGMTYRSLSMEREFQALIDRFGADHRFADPTKLADLYSKVRGVRALVYRNVEQLMNATPTIAGPSVAKLIWSEAHQQMMSVFIGEAGRSAVLMGTEFTDLGLLDLGARAHTIYAGTSEIQRDLIARDCGLDSAGEGVERSLPGFSSGGMGETLLDWLSHTQQFPRAPGSASPEMGSMPEDWMALVHSGWLNYLAELMLEENRPVAERAKEIVEVGRALGRCLPSGPISLVSGYLLPLSELLDLPQLRTRLADGQILTAQAPHLADTTGELTVSDIGTLSGRLDSVPWAGTASAVFATARIDGTLSAVLLPTAHPRVHVVDSAAIQLGQRLGTVRIDDLALADVEILTSDEPALRFAQARAACAYHVAMSTMALGAAEAALLQTVKHVSGREQFGRPLSAFQAVRHRVADMRAVVELGSAMVDVAAEGLLEGEPCLDDIAASRIITADGLKEVAEAAIQLHGGMGFCWETGVHEFYRAGWWQLNGEAAAAAFKTDFSAWEFTRSR